MPLTINIDNPDQLQTLLQKANAIKTINQENLKYIQSRKDEEIVTSQRYDLQNKHVSGKKQKTNHHGSQASSLESINDQRMTLVDDSTTKTIADIILAWKYTGIPLNKETIAFDSFIELKLKRFDDLTRLHDSYDRLLEKYSRVLVDEVESRAAVEVILHNVETLQVAAGEIHEMVINAKYKTEMNDAMSRFMQTVSGGLKTLHAEMPGVCIDFNAKVVNKVKEQDLVELGDVKRLTPRQIVGETARVMELYVMNGKPHVAIGKNERKIDLWDLSSYTRVATLQGNVDAWDMISYVQNGVQMLACRGRRGIDLLDLSNNTITNVFVHYDDNYMSRLLAVYEKDGKNILMIATDLKSRKSRIKIIDLESHAISEFCINDDDLNAALVYQYSDRSFLAGGGRDGTIKIWGLDNYKMVKSIGETLAEVNHLTTAYYHDELVLVGCYKYGCIKLWSLKTNKCVAAFQSGCSDHIHCLEAVRYCGVVCFIIISGKNNKIEIWDIEKKSCIASLDSDHRVYDAKAFMYNGKGCLLTRSHCLELWTEDKPIT